MYTYPSKFVVLLLLLLAVSSNVVQCSIIASSKVQICKKLTSEPLSRTGDFCDKKFLVALSVRNGQVGYLYSNYTTVMSRHVIPITG